MKHLIINKRGEGYIDTVVEVLVSMILIVLALNVFQCLTLKQDLDHFAKEMITAATVSGRAEAADRYQELAEETGLRPDCSWSADYFDAVKHRVQLGDTMTLTLTCRTSFQGFGVFNFPLTLTVKQSGLSQKYWKEAG